MTEPWKKLNWKAQDPILILGGPGSFSKELASLETKAAVHRKPKAYRSDLNRGSCWAVLKPLGLQPVRQVAVDDDWSALRLKRMG